MIKLFNSRVIVPVSAIAGTALATSSAYAIDVSGVTAELATAATSAGALAVAALLVAGTLMAGFMLVRRL